MRAVKHGIGQGFARLAPALALCLCLALFAAGCKGSIEVYPYNKELAGLSEQGGEVQNERPKPTPTPRPASTPRPTSTPQPTPTPIPVLTRDEAWKIPDPYGYQDETGTQYKDYYFRDLRGDYPMPDTVEVELTAGQRQALDDFFAARPELVERIGTHNFGSAHGYLYSHRVMLMDLTGDGAPEILIPYISLHNDARLAGGVIEVYELSSGRYLGKLYTSERPENCIGWYRGADGADALYVLGYQNFVKGTPPRFRAGYITSPISSGGWSMTGIHCNQHRSGFMTLPTGRSALWRALSITTFRSWRRTRRRWSPFPVTHTPNTTTFLTWHSRAQTR